MYLCVFFIVLFEFFFVALFFFFQAEDGIRDATVTGVQTCALPILPKLCATDSLAAYGSCRLCVVEIEGRKGYPASCTTPVEAGLKVRTQTPRVANLRRNVMELYISDH